LKMLSERNKFPSPFSSGGLFDKKNLKL
jgi:hypothetical protein